MRPWGDDDLPETVWGHKLAVSFDAQAYCFEQMLRAMEATESPGASLIHDPERKRHFRVPARGCMSPGFEEVESALSAAWDQANFDRRKEGLVLDEFNRIAPLRSCPIGSAGWGMELYDYMKIIREKKLAEQKENFAGERYMGANNAA